MIKNTNGGKCKRTESVNIKMALSDEAFFRHEQDVQTLIPGWEGALVHGDTLKVNYKFVIEYFDDVDAKLHAIHHICKSPDVVLEASCEELEAGRLLVYKVLNRLEALIGEVRSRDES